MARHENPNPPLGTIVEILALFRTGQIKRESLDSGSQANLNFYLALMSEDRNFAQQVIARQQQMAIASGYKPPLYSQEQIKKMKKLRKRRKRSARASQLPLWQAEQVLDGQTSETGSVFDPEAKLHGFGRVLDTPYYRYIKHTPITAEIRKKRKDLRMMIGLPEARGKNPHVKDPRYQYLVEKVVKMDKFRIFREFDRVLDEIPEELRVQKFPVLHVSLL